MRELEAQVRAWARGEPLPRKVYPHQIAFNVIPQVDTFGANGYTGEETKMAAESRKIMGLPDLKVSATCVRVPVVRAHSVAINAEFERPVERRGGPRGHRGVPRGRAARRTRPEPLSRRRWTYSEQVKCGVGRIRLDTAFDNGLAFWVSGDNLWKGAALNSIQNAELMHREGLLKPKAALAAV